MPVVGKCSGAVAMASWDASGASWIRTAVAIASQQGSSPWQLMDDMNMATDMHQRVGAGTDSVTNSGFTLR